MHCPHSQDSYKAANIIVILLGCLKVYTIWSIAKGSKDLPIGVIFFTFYKFLDILIVYLQSSFIVKNSETAFYSNMDVVTRWHVSNIS